PYGRSSALPGLRTARPIVFAHLPQRMPSRRVHVITPYGFSPSAYYAVCTSKDQMYPLHLVGFVRQWSHCLLHMLDLGLYVCADGCLFYELTCSLSKGNVSRLILRTRGQYKSSFPQR